MENAENILFTIAMIGYFASLACCFFFEVSRKDGARKVAQALHISALVLHTAALVLRGIAAGRLPMTNQYEFATCFAWALALVSLAFIWKYKFPLLGVLALPVVFLIMGYAAMQSREIKPLMPALQSGWLAFHVSTAIIAYGAFGVSATLGTFFLWRERIRKDSFLDRHIPETEKLDLICS